MTARSGRLALSLVLLLSATAAAAADHVVRMRNTGAAGMMVFEPDFVRTAPGDTIRFVPTDAGHNAETIPGLWPAGAAPFSSPVGKPYDLKLVRPGLYGVRCKPHFGLGMVMLVVVGTGTAPNLVTAKAAPLPPLAARRMQPLLAKAGR